MSRILASLRFRLIILVLLALLPTLGMTLYAGLEQRCQSTAEAQADALRLARLAASRQDQLIEQARQLLMALGSFPKCATTPPPVTVSSTICSRNIAPTRALAPPTRTAMCIAARRA